MGTKFYLDHDESRSVPLHAVRQAGTWNGHPVPMVTADQFRAFIAEWEAVDPNGAWNHLSVTEVPCSYGPVLVYADSATDSTGHQPTPATSRTLEEWPAATFTTDGPLYALDGWTWTL